MDEKSHLCLHGIQATRPVDRIPYAHISTLPDASYPRALFVCVHQLLINPLLLQPAQYGDRTMGPYPEKAVYFTVIFTNHTCQYSININLVSMHCPSGHGRVGPETPLGSSHWRAAHIGSGKSLHSQTNADR